MTGPHPASILRHLAGGDPEPADRDLLGRFAATRDADAFAALVRRHGPVVLAACRRGVRHHHDAEDAFQAVFLTLARRAGSVRRPELLGNWLYRVAVNVSRNARRVAARRRRREVLAVEMPEPAAPQAPAQGDLGPVLDEELDALPALYRDAVVLCDLRGISRADAAAQLGVPLGTLASRLDGGRKKLAARLVRRGVTLSVAMVLVEARAVAVPEGLFTKACEVVAVWSGGGALPRPVVKLVQGVLSMRGVVLAGVVALVAGVAVAAGLSERPAPPLADPPKAAVPPNAVAEGVAAPPAPGQDEGGPQQGFAARLRKSDDLAVRSVTGVAWSPDGAWVAVAGTAAEAPRGPGSVGTNTLVVLAADDRPLPPAAAPLPQHTRLLGFAANSRQVLTETREGGLISGTHHVQLWDVHAPRPGGPAGTPADAVRVSPGNRRSVDEADAVYAPGLALNEVRYLARKGGDVEVRWFDMAGGGVTRLGAIRGTFPLVRFAPNGRQVVAVSAAGAVSLYDPDGERRWVTPPPPEPPALTFDLNARSATAADLPLVVAVARDGSRVLVIRGRSAPLVLDAATGGTLPAPEGVGVVETAGPGAAVSGDGRLAALAFVPVEPRPAGKDGAGLPAGSYTRGNPRLVVWETATGQVVRTWEGRAEAVAFHPTRQVLAVLEANGAVTRLGLWDFTAQP